MSNELNFKYNGDYISKQYYHLDDDTIAEISQGNEYAESPRECYDYNSKLITFERNYASPDGNEFNDWDDMMKHFGTKNTGHMYNDLESLMENAVKKGYVLLPVWKYDHGTVCYQASEHYPFPKDGYPNSTPGYEGGWDGGLCGVIYEKRDRRNIDKVKDQLKDEVDTYNKWVNNEFYTVDIYDRDGDLLEPYGEYYDLNDIAGDIGAKPIQDLGSHSDIHDCLDNNQDYFEKHDKSKQNNIER